MVSLDSTNFQKIQSQNFQIFVRLITQKMQKLDKIPKISKKKRKISNKKSGATGHNRLHFQS